MCRDRVCHMQISNLGELKLFSLICEDIVKTHIHNDFIVNVSAVKYMPTLCLLLS